ncbi:hypothetical protein Droror1_Dr00016777 [Drosera rotundifolia]
MYAAVIRRVGGILNCTNASLLSAAAQRNDHLIWYTGCGRSDSPNPSFFMRLGCFLSSLARDEHAFGIKSWSAMCVRHMSGSALELRTGGDVVRFSFESATSDKSKGGLSSKMDRRVGKKKKMSKKAKVNELRFYRLKAKKKMRSPNPEIRIRYKLEKAKRKELWLIEKLRKYEVPKALAEKHDPDFLTEEERFYLKRTGEKKKNYVPVGRRGVFGGVVLNMHLHWKKHETVKVVCKCCKPGQVHAIAEELARLSKCTVIDIKPDDTIIFYRGKNYVRPDVMSPPDTLSKAKALEKYRYQQSLEHTSWFIEKLERELEEYHQHLARFRLEKEHSSKGHCEDLKILCMT